MSGFEITSEQFSKGFAKQLKTGFEPLAQGFAAAGYAAGAVAAYVFAPHTPILTAAEIALATVSAIKIVDCVVSAKVPMNPEKAALTNFGRITAAAAVPGLQTASRAVSGMRKNHTYEI